MRGGGHGETRALSVTQYQPGLASDNTLLHSVTSAVTQHQQQHLSSQQHPPPHTQVITDNFFLDVPFQAFKQWLILNA